MYCVHLPLVYCVHCVHTHPDMCMIYSAMFQIVSPPLLPQGPPFFFIYVYPARLKQRAPPLYAAVLLVNRHTVTVTCITVA